jgi:restriction endonuclease
MKAGEKFERAVAATLSLFTDQASVQHSERLVDRLGDSREFDVVIRGTLTGLPILAVVECRDKKRPANVSEIEAFIQKSRDVYANLAIFASASGFTKKALRKADHGGVTAISLMGESWQGGFRLLRTLYGRQVIWEPISFQVRAAVPFIFPPPTSSTFNEIRVDVEGRNLAAWVRSELDEQSNLLAEQPTRFVRGIEFSSTKIVRIGECECRLNGIRFETSGRIQWLKHIYAAKGEGYIDFARGYWCIPANAWFCAAECPTDPAKWETCSEKEAQAGIDLEKKSGPVLIVPTFGLMGKEKTVLDVDALGQVLRE